MKIDNRLINNSFLPLFFFVIFLRFSSSSSVVSTGNFNKDFTPAGPTSSDRINTSDDGRTRTIRLDQQSGSGFTSNDLYLFGQIGMQIKLVQNHSAGTVVAFYLSSDDQRNRDEIDFEFLGNVTGQPYILQTNVYADGIDDREERIFLWFDPTLDFHTYSVLWNRYQIVFMVDWVPIRLYRNHADKGVPYPSNQPMSVRASIWDGSSWATRGGKDKVDWSKGPFTASFRNYKIDACVPKGNPVGYCNNSSSSFWWNDRRLSSLSSYQRRLFKWVRQHHLVYDYCEDNVRFKGSVPKECRLPKY